MPKKTTKVRSKKRSKSGESKKGTAKFPRHSLEKSLRIPEAILQQNAGKSCSDQDAARYLGLTSAAGPFQLEISSASKYGLLERPASGQIAPTELAKKILRPQAQSDKINGLREALLQAPDLGDVYNHYRNENLPDAQFFENALQDKFNIPVGKVSEFKDIFISSLKYAELCEDINGKLRIIDATEHTRTPGEKTDTLIKLEKSVKVAAGDSCFVVMPFAKPIGDYYEKVYQVAIKNSGLQPVRADSEIFGAGKIIDQIWSGINQAKVLIADLTGRNPNVFYELGLAHALGKPVVLVCSNENDVPFDLKHIRVIYYDQTDPFWGVKLIDKISENILSALKDPEEAIFQTALLIESRAK